MSLYEFIKRSCKSDFNLDKISFNLKCFEIAGNKSINKEQLKHLALHLASPNTHNSAIAVLTPTTSETIGHAVSMYKFCQDQKSFFYKDSSVRAYQFFNSRTNTMFPQENG